MKNHYSFIGGDVGQWRVTGQSTIIGAPLASVTRIEVINSPATHFSKPNTWMLQGFTSNVVMPTEMKL